MSENVIDIDSARPWWRLGVLEAWERRDLLLLLLRKDLLASYKQSLLGPVWFVIQPLATALVFGLIFGRFARLSPPNVPPFLYYLAGYVLWNYFQTTVAGVASSLATNVGTLQKVYFPRLIIPLVSAGVMSVHFLVNYLVFLLVYAGFVLFGGFSGPLTPTLLLLVPLLPIFVGLTGAGVGIWLASWSVTYRDLRLGLPVLLNLWMFATPIIWPLRMVPPAKRWLFALNPMTSAVELHRALFLGTGELDLTLLFVGIAVGITVLCVGLVFFSRAQGTLVDTL